TQTASPRTIATAPAILLIGNDPTNQHPLVAWQIRNSVRLNKARLYVVNHGDIKLRRQAAAVAAVAAGKYNEFVSSGFGPLAHKLRRQPGLAILFCFGLSCA